MLKRPSVIIFILLLVVPTLELAAVMAVGKQIGLVPTLTLLIVESLLGAWIVRREGLHAWRGLSGALASAKMPSKEIADAALVLFGGALLLTPGFITDVVGFLCVLPFTRPIARAMLTSALSRQVAKAAANPSPSGFTVHQMSFGGQPGDMFGQPGGASSTSPGPHQSSPSRAGDSTSGQGIPGMGTPGMGTPRQSTPSRSRNGVIEGEVID